jgi:membrane protein DedA with SNARE-associated domain/membrane-associated phospholipid phosphatase
MPGEIGGLLHTYGYGVLFLFVGLESLGVPLPGETALVTAAAFAASGYLSIYGVIATAAIAGIAGDNGGYWIGRRGGLALIRRYGRALDAGEPRLDRVRAFFERHGAKAVFLGRFVAILRTWTAIIAGAGQMRYGTFMLFNALGAIVWASAFGTLGYVFGRNVPQLERYVGQASLAIVLLLAIAISLGLGWQWFQRNAAQLSERLSRTAGGAGAPRAFEQLRRRFPRAWAFLGSRLATGEYLGLHLTIGLLVSLVGLWGFAGITEDVIHHDPLTQIDVSLLEWFHRHQTPLGVTIFGAITWLGSPIFITTVGLLTSAILARRRLWIPLLSWVLALAGDGALESVLKHAIQRPRPIYASAFLHGNSFSFPSGHAMGSLVTYGMCAYLAATFWARRRSTRVVVSAAAFVLVVAIGLSRLYLGVHYFSDVVAGYAAGTVWLAACTTGCEIARRRGVETRA